MPRRMRFGGRAAFPTHVAPMLASMGSGAFDDPEWVFEPKLDGIRAIALVREGNARLLSRRGLDMSLQYPGLNAELVKSYRTDLVLDGEIVALDENGRPNFQRLQARINLTRKEDILRAEGTIPVVYYVFDLLYYDRYDLREVPLQRRKETLAAVLSPSNLVHVVEHFAGEGVAAYDASIALGLEGVIAKRRSSCYHSGRRSKEWLKIKAADTAEFVVGGFTQGAGRRAEGFGALLVGTYIGHDKLRYAGHVGTGFDERTVADLRCRLDAIRTEQSPFADKPPLHAPAMWVRPELVVEVKFAELTLDGHLRAPVYLRLRPDVPPATVGRPEVTHVAPQPPEHEPDQVDRFVARQAITALEQLEMPGNNLVLHVGAHALALNNLDKELWPQWRGRRALTKRDLVVYLCKVAPYLLPHMRDRPLTLVRYPHGILSGRFFQKHWVNPLPDYVETVTLYGEQAATDQDYLTCNNLPTLLWLGQIADLELHCWLARTNPEPDARHIPSHFTGSAENIKASVLNYPDFIAFDLDPFIYSGKEPQGAEPELNRKAFAKVCQVALWLKDALDSLSLHAFVKTSGGTGLHVFVPVIRELDYDEVRSASATIAKYLLRLHPKDITIAWPVVKRAGKILVDYNQNTRGKTLATIYSPRALPGATVSMPLSWDELPDIYPTDFTILTAPDLIPLADKKWAHILEAKKRVVKREQ